MLRYIDHKKMGHANHGWLDSHFHFSFAEYCNPDNVNFGVLRVLNDDTVKPGEGFDTHPHENMEIISYVIEGELTHGDNMGNKHTLTRGQAQYMSAGTGVLHSEFNLGKDLLRFLQIWIFPNEKGYKPAYGDFRFNWEDRLDRFMPVATGYDNKTSEAPIKIHQDINAYAAFISAGKKLDFELKENRQAYLVLIEGRADITAALSDKVSLETRDAAEITGEAFEINALQDAHVFVIEMAREAD